MIHRLDEILDNLLVFNTKKIYHYTTIQAFFNGIVTKEDICLWATNAQYLNDPTELVGFKIIQFLLDREYSKVILQKMFKSTADGYFVTSFSSHSDNLPMWSMYGANGTGISLGFDRKKIESNIEDAIVKCYYVQEDSIIKTVFGVENVDELDKFLIPQTQNPTKKEILTYFTKSIFDIFVLIYLAKNQYYKYENEIRLITNLKSINIEDYSTPESIKKLYSRLLKNEFNIEILEEERKRIKYRIKNNHIVPYIEHHLPKETLSEIIIGPNNNMDLSEKSLRTYLDHLGYEHVKIKRSKVPYRG